MRKLVVASNMYNEIKQLQGDDWLSNWWVNMSEIADAGIVIVDNGSTDGTKEFFESKDNVRYVIDDIIVKEGYGPARNHLRAMSKKYFPDALWCLYLDGDERINPSDYHRLRFLKDNLADDYDVIALPRKNMIKKGSRETKRDINVHMDPQARMSRLDSEKILYVDRVHESLTGHRGLLLDINNPHIEHYHHDTDKEKRDQVGKLCVHLWNKQDEENPGKYVKHHKHDLYEGKLKQEGTFL